MPSIWWPEIFVSFVRNRISELILDFDSAFGVMSGSSLCSSDEHQHLCNFFKIQ